MGRSCSYISHPCLPQLPDINTQTIPRLCFGVEDVDALDGYRLSKDWRRRWTGFSFISTLGGEAHSWHKIVREVVEDDEMQKMKRRISQLEKALKKGRITPA